MSYLDNTGLTKLWGKIKGLFYTKSEIDTKLNSKAPSSHNHTWSEVENKPSIKTFMKLSYCASYVEFVIPLFELTNTDIGANFYVDGEIYLKRKNTIDNMLTKVYVIGGKFYNSMKPVISVKIDGKKRTRECCYIYL